MTLILKVNRHINNYAITDLGKPNGKMLVNTIDNKWLIKINGSVRIERFDDEAFRLTLVDSIESSEFKSVNVRFDIGNTSTLTIDENSVLNSTATIVVEQHANVTILNSVIFTNYHTVHFRTFGKIINSTIFESKHNVLDNVEIIDKCLFIHPSIPKPLDYPKAPYVPSLRETLIVLLTNDYTSATYSDNDPKTIILKNEDCTKNICVKNVKKFYQVYDEAGCISYMMFVGVGEIQIYRFADSVNGNTCSHTCNAIGSHACSHTCSNTSYALGEALDVTGKYACSYISNAISNMIDAIRQNESLKDELRELRKQYSPPQHFNPRFIVNYTDDILFKLKHLKEHPNATNKELDEIFKHEPIKIINVQRRAKLFINDSILSKTPYCVNINTRQRMTLYQYHDFTSIFHNTGAYNYIPNLLMKCVLDINCTDYESLGYDIDVHSRQKLLNIINKPRTREDDWLRTIGID